jgi:hypothetical protein
MGAAEEETADTAFVAVQRASGHRSWEHLSAAVNVASLVKEQLLILLSVVTRTQLGSAYLLDMPHWSPSSGLHLCNP